MALRVLALDWSGARAPNAQRRKIWCAQIGAGGALRLEAGRTREEWTRALLDDAARDPRFAVGLDFAFSLPAWFLRRHGLRSTAQLWARAEALGERWLEDCEPPFWGRHGRPAPRSGEPELRRSEAELAGLLGGRAAPESVFKLVGPKQVGPGSLRGMPCLRRLRAAGFSVWPFDPPGWPRVVEIFPRALLRGNVAKSQPKARRAYLDAHHPALPSAVRGAALASDDAFDALVSAVALARHGDELERLVPARDDGERLEGRIWLPEALSARLCRAAGPACVGSPGRPLRRQRAGRR